MTTTPQLIDVLVIDRRNAAMAYAAQRRTSRSRLWRRPNDVVTVT